MGKKDESRNQTKRNVLRHVDERQKGERDQRKCPS